MNYFSGWIVAAVAPDMSVASDGEDQGKFRDIPFLLDFHLESVSDLVAAVLPDMSAASESEDNGKY